MTTNIHTKSQYSIRKDDEKGLIYHHSERLQTLGVNLTREAQGPSISTRPPRPGELRELNGPAPEQTVRVTQRVIKPKDRKQLGGQQGW